MTPVIFTQRSYEHPGWLRMQRSCIDCGWNLVWRIEPFSEKGFWENFFAALPGFRNNGFTHALRLDAFDIIAQGSPSELPAILEHYHHPKLLMGAEGAIWPTDYPRASEYSPRAHTWWYAHSPIILDLNQDTSELQSRLSFNSYGADQKWLADLLLDKTPGVEIDRDCKFIQSLAHSHPWQKHFELADASTDTRAQPKWRVRNKFTGSLPLFCHGNGRADMSWIP